MHYFSDRDSAGTRREFLRVGGWAAVGAAGLTLGQIASMQARAAAGSTPGLLTGKSVIFPFLHGGPSQLETFDPKMDRPEGVRSATGEVATSLPWRDHRWLVHPASSRKAIFFCHRSASGTTAPSSSRSFCPR